jgi:hypothetical protein
MVLRRGCSAIALFAIFATCSHFAQVVQAGPEQPSASQLPELVPITRVPIPSFYPVPYACFEGEPFITPFQYIAFYLKFHDTFSKVPVPPVCNPITGLSQPHLRVTMPATGGCIAGTSGVADEAKDAKRNHDVVVFPDCSMQDYSLPLLVRLFSADGGFSGTEATIKSTVSNIIRGDLRVEPGVFGLEQWLIKKMANGTLAITTVVKLPAGKRHYHLTIKPDGKVSAWSRP